MFVAAELIRPLDAGPGSPSKMALGGSLREGMKVEARFKGKLRYYPGVIKRENRDGTFDIDYDDVNIRIVYHFCGRLTVPSHAGREGDVCGRRADPPVRTSWRCFTAH